MIKVSKPEYDFLGKVRILNNKTAVPHLLFQSSRTPWGGVARDARKPCKKKDPRKQDTK
jgi:hypothetical protein